MLKSSDLSDPKSKISECIKNYKSAQEGFSGNWEGDSFDKFTEQASAFAEAFNSDVEAKFSAMEGFCDQYEQLKTLDGQVTNLKTAYEQAERKYNAISNDDEHSTEKETAKSNMDAAKEAYDNALKDLNDQANSLAGSVSI